MMLHKGFFSTSTLLIIIVAAALVSSSLAFVTQTQRTAPPPVTTTTPLPLRGAFVRSTAVVSFLRMSASAASDFASKDQVSKALEDERTTILDVRRPDEIAETGHWEASGCGWAHMPCTPVDADLLEKTAASMLRDKSAPVIIHCASGKRAAKAKEVLDNLGYEQVLNAGGWIEVQELKNED